MPPSPTIPPPADGLRPVFIGGCGRSGTTLLGALLGAGSRAICVPEAQFKTRVLQRAERVPGGLDPQAVWRDLRSSRRLRDWGLDLPASPPVAVASRAAFAALIEWLVRRYAERHGKAAADVWIDHTPTNLAHASTLVELFPAARFIHLVRDGRSVAASILPLDWGPNSIDEAARWWLESVAFGLGAESWGGPARVLRVRYEDLVGAPGPKLAEVCAFLDVPAEPAMVRGGGFSIPAYTLDQHRLAAQPPDPRRASAWEHELAPRAVEIFESIAGVLLVDLGYPLRHAGGARRPSALERRKLRLHSLWRRFANRWRRRRRRARGQGTSG